MQTHGLGMETPNALPGMLSERMQRIRGRLHVSELHALRAQAQRCKPGCATHRAHPGIYLCEILSSLGVALDGRSSVGARQAAAE